MKAYTLPLSIIVLAVSFLVAVFLWNSQGAEGSVSQGSEYKAEYVTTTDANSTSTLRTLFGSIGSVVVSNAGTGGSISFYATTSQATSSDDLIFTFDGAAAEGTYQYDVEFGTGLLIDVATGTDLDAVVTYR